MTTDLKRIFFLACLVVYGLIVHTVATTSATILEGLTTAVIFTLIAVAAYYFSENP